MRVAIIGAGAAGLCSARHITTQGFNCDVYEASSDLGGTWIYDDNTGEDEYGYPVLTAMYRDLRTNLPKEVMGFPDFPIPQQTASFLPQKVILEFINLYADHFKLKEFIKFEEVVTEVRPLGDKWQIKSIHKPTKKETTKIFDVVMVCNGHHNTPSVPHIEGQEKFNGKITHSFHYRYPESYKDQTVLVVGAGFSGLDLALQISSVAQHVTLSHHVLKKEVLSKCVSNISEKPEVIRIRNEKEVEFADGTCHHFDSIVFCTGYKFNYPFLHESCGVTVEDNCVQPLYKHLIHIQRPTMCFVGLPFFVCPFQLFDLQVRFYCQYLNGFMTLPSKEEMLKETEADMRRRKEKGYLKKMSHMLGHLYQQEYYDDLAATAKITPIPPVVSKIWSQTNERVFDSTLTFRGDRYRVLNNETFVLTKAQE